MVLTNFPNGVSSFGVPVMGSGDIPSTGGTYFFVSSVIGADGYDGSYETPFATLDYAIGKCTADKGDVIVVLPNHAESVIAAGTITADVAGVTIVGLGYGDERPTLTFSTATAASFLISANNVTVTNILGVAGIDSIANPFDITGDNCTLDIEWQDVQGSYGAVRAVRGVGSDNLKVNLRFRGDTAMSSGINAVRLTNVKGARIHVDFYGVVTTAVVQMITTQCLDVIVTGSTYVVGTTDGSLNVVDTVGTSTWSAEIWDGSAGAAYSGGHNSAIAKDDISAISDALYGANGITTWPTAAAYANAVSMAEVLAYVQDGVRRGTGTTLPANISLFDILAGAGGVPAWPTAAAYANDVSLAEVIGYIQDAVRRGTGTVLPANTSLFDLAERGVTTGTAVIANGLATIFTVAGGPIVLTHILGVCVTPNDATATTLKFSADPTDGAATDLCAASASLANAAAGTIVNITGTVANAAVITAAGTAIEQAGGLVIPAGIITTTTAVGATTGTWYFAMRYKPMRPGVTVTAAY